MARELPQISFEFSDKPEETPKEFLSGSPVPQPPKAKGRGGRRSLKEGEGDAESPEVPPDDILFGKLYWSISEVAAMFKVNTSLIRSWEIEFDILNPRKNRKGDRFFRPVDVKNIELIYDLIRRRKYTIEGAKEHLRRNQKAKDFHTMVQSLQKIRSFLLEVKANL